MASLPVLRGYKAQTTIAAITAIWPRLATTLEAAPVTSDCVAPTVAVAMVLPVGCVTGGLVGVVTVVLPDGRATEVLAV